VVRSRNVAAACALVVGVLGLAGCGGNENTLSAHSPQQHSITHLWWVMLIASCIGFAVIVALLLTGWIRRNKPELPDGHGEKVATWLVVGLGVALPIVVLAALFVWSDIIVIRSTAAPPPGTTAFTVHVTGHDWWWEAQYVGTTAVTANEIHIPLDTRVQIVGTSDDVIHSFWVPELNRKIDLIPGRTNRLVFDATKTGVYRGQCSEFCGLQHAHMTITVVVEPAAAFRRWLANMERPARVPATAGARRGEVDFLTGGCANCHAIRGTSAHGDVGPDLTHLMTRMTIAAGELPNTRSYLRAWIADPQATKPGVRMPALPLTSRELDLITTYLETLH
jgi:cytochrome c oxidase subunit 2